METVLKNIMETVEIIPMCCVCGNKTYENYIESVFAVVTNTGALEQAQNYHLGKCSSCGLVRQVQLPFNSDEEYRDYYTKYPATLQSYTAKDWNHDVEVANKRCDSYGIKSAFNRKMLDVGSGSGAFVEECRKRGQESYGCEISTYHYERSSDFIYRKTFEDVNFPVDYFDLVTCHDVLEHSLDPTKMLKEIFRVVKQNGNAIIDIPDFFHPQGKHHWKTEHIWYFTEQHLTSLLETVGFVVNKIDHPIEGKSVYFCTKPQQHRQRILIPPGMGDVYWVMTKMQSFLEKEGIGIPDVYMMCPTVLPFAQHERSLKFAELYPFVHVAGMEHNGPFSNGSPMWKEAWHNKGRTVFRNPGVGYDYGLSFNAYFGAGIPLENISPEYICNWHPPMFSSIDQENSRKSYVQQYGKYLVLHFICKGMFRNLWLKEFPVERLSESIKTIVNTTGVTPIFAGAKWDKENSKELNWLCESIPGNVDLLGKTSVDQLIGLLKGAQGTVGHPSGVTILSGIYGTPTLLINHRYYNDYFIWNMVPPEVRGESFFVVNTSVLTTYQLSKGTIEMLETGKTSVSQPVLDSSHIKIDSPVISKSTNLRVVNARPPIHLRKPIAPIPTLPIVERIPDLAAVTVMCVLKSGSKDYTPDYVSKLKSMVERHSTVAYRFVCLTDVRFDVPGVEQLPLLKNLAGWWSKLELFAPGKTNTPYIVYFDLDTVIINNIDNILNLQVDFAGVGAWMPGLERNKPEYFNSSLMIWRNNEDFSFLHDEYKGEYYRDGDQEYIVKSLINHNVKYKTLQEITTGIYSYKRNCLTGIPSDAKVICFHGRPRPSEAARTVGWVRSYWR